MQGQAVTSIQLTGRLAEIHLSLANGLHLASMMTAESDPAWALSRRIADPWVSVFVRAGRLVLETKHAQEVS